MKYEYLNKCKYKKLIDYFQNRFDKISNKGKISRLKFFRLVFLDMILDWLETKIYE